MPEKVTDISSRLERLNNTVQAATDLPRPGLDGGIPRRTSRRVGDAGSQRLRSRGGVTDAGKPILCQVSGAEPVGGHVDDHRGQTQPDLRR